MRTRLIRLSMAIGLMLSVFTTTEPVSASTGNCQDILASNKWTGTYGYSTNGSDRRGVDAYITVESASLFGPCTTGPGNDGASAWVALVPHPNDGTLNSNTIIQIGVIRCNNAVYAVCNGQTLHYFWAYGGCGFALPKPRDLGAATYGSHRFSIKHSPNSNFYYFYIDGVFIDSLNIGYGDVSCWLGDAHQLQAQWQGERWDVGDDLGDNSTYSTSLDTMRYMTAAGGAWVYTNFSTGTQCPVHDTRSNCTYAGPSRVNLWTP